MALPITKGPKAGRCNICGQHGRLTADHVPPKGTLRFPRMVLNSITDALNAEPPARNKGRIFQNGVKFNSLCERCNRDVLGTLYDPELVAFANAVSKYLHSSVILPNIGSFSIKPGLIARAIAGHILAIGVEQFPRGDMGEAMAEMVLAPNSPMPEKLKMYYWLYPYWDQVSIRGCGYLVRWGAPPLVISVLKFMPLAFMVAWDVDPRLNIPHANLIDFAAGRGAESVNVPVNFVDVPHQRYPEAPRSEGAVLHGSESYLAERKK